MPWRTWSATRPIRPNAQEPPDRYDHLSAGGSVALDREDAQDKWSQINKAWHFRLYGAANSPQLLQFISTLWDRCRLTSHAYARDVSHRSTSDQDHGRVMEAIRNRDPDLAAMIISLHVRNAMDNLLRNENT